MRALLAGLMLTLTASASNAARIEQGQFELNGRVKINQDKGNLVIVSSNAKTLTYRVEFTSAFFKGDVNKSKVTVNGNDGLTVEAGTGVHAKTILYVPANVQVDVQFGDGTVNLGNLSGLISASVANGTLTFDSSNVAKNGGVRARATNGAVKTPWGNSGGTGAKIATSEKPTVTLSVGNGTVIVK